MKNKFLLQFLLIAFWFSYMSTASAMSLETQREAFLKAETLLKKGDETGFLSEMNALKDYALYPYLQYQWLKNNLHKEREIQLFFTAYKDSRYAELLRQEWLLKLAEQGQWQKFLDNYQTSKKIALQCNYQLAKYKTGEQQQALEAAKNLWLEPYSQPPECNDLFSVFTKSSLFTQDLVWQRFKAALRTGKKRGFQLAQYLTKQMSGEEKRSAQLWLKVHSKPAIITNSKKWDTKGFNAGDIFAHGIYRLSREKLGLAIKIWENDKNDYQISEDSLDYTEKNLGLRLAYKGQHYAAYSYLSRVETPDAEARQWRVRAALRLEDWKKVNDALANLSDEEKQEEQWRYWQARAYEQTGAQEQATTLFTELSKERSYYGFAAADKINASYQLNDKPVVLKEKALDKLKNKAEFKMIKELFALGRDKEAKWDWWFTVKRLDTDGIKTAAKLAEEWDMIQTAVFTIAKAEYWDDVKLRFPIAFKDEIIEHAKKQNLQPAVVFGLIRQESVFDEYAGSYVGARGLMQIMPATGRQIARELNEKWHSAASLYEPETNLRYGTYYYKQLLDKFDGQVALAAAGYNAGPHRVKRWRPDKPMAMDIWIETIPFDETRKYVSIILANALIYQQRLNRGDLKMEDFLSKVQPG